MHSQNDCLDVSQTTKFGTIAKVFAKGESSGVRRGLQEREVGYLLTESDGKESIAVAEDIRCMSDWNTRDTLPEVEINVNYFREKNAVVYSFQAALCCR